MDPDYLHTDPQHFVPSSVFSFRYHLCLGQHAGTGREADPHVLRHLPQGDPDARQGLSQGITGCSRHRHTFGSGSEFIWRRHPYSECRPKSYLIFLN